MQKDNLRLVIVFSAATVLLCLSLSIIGTSYAQKQIIQDLAVTMNTTTPPSSSSPSTYNITLGSPLVSFTDYDKTTSFKPVTVNGTHGIEVSFTGHGILNGMNITDHGNAVITNGTGGTIFTAGDAWLVSNNGAGTLAFAFQGTGHYGADGKLRDIGSIFQHHHLIGKLPIAFKATGNLAFLDNTVAIYKDEIDKAGNAVTKIWFWK
jgi:hypothetical protein